jgi:hypothetical protein
LSVTAPTQRTTRTTLHNCAVHYGGFQAVLPVAGGSMPPDCLTQHNHSVRTERPDLMQIYQILPYKSVFRMFAAFF